MGSADLESGAPHISERFCAILWCCVNTYLDRRAGAWISSNEDRNPLRRKQIFKIFQEWGLDFSTPNPLGQPLRHKDRCAWTTFAGSRPFLFILYRIVFRDGRKSYPIECELGRNNVQNKIRAYVSRKKRQIPLTTSRDLNWRFGFHYSFLGSCSYLAKKRKQPHPGQLKTFQKQNFVSLTRNFGSSKRNIV